MSFGFTFVAILVFSSACLEVDEDHSPPALRIMSPGIAGEVVNQKRDQQHDGAAG